mmetsp:Transcript_286/g.574  ORF Transcript_286/g.574 Transcript_286/m.574 type:complete len:120 (-) Transcript_286:434-793(-)
MSNVLFIRSNEGYLCRRRYTIVMSVVTVSLTKVRVMSFAKYHPLPNGINNLERERGDFLNSSFVVMLRLLVRGVDGSLSMGKVPYMYSKSSDDILSVSSSLCSSRRSSDFSFSESSFNE